MVRRWFRVRGGVRHDAILDTLIGGGEMTITDIAEASGVLYKTAARRLTQMVKAGEIDQVNPGQKPVRYRAA